MPRLPSRLRIFLWLSLALALTDAIFVWINYRAEQQRFERGLEDHALHLRALFEVETHNTALRMLQTATFIASMPEVQQTFLDGLEAVAEETGGGAGGPRAAAARAHLLTLVKLPWEGLQQHYDTRQLHFEFGPHATSFLRVHLPERFGDDLESVRHTIFDAIATRDFTSGFECGRAYCGVRGVAPVLASRPDEATRRFIGVVEAGTSFQTLLRLIEEPSQARFSVLLSAEHLREVQFPEFFATAERAHPPIADFFIEASLHESELRGHLAEPALQRLLRETGTTWVQLGRRALAFSAFELRDYQGARDPELAPVGRVLISRDVTTNVDRLRADLRMNIAYAIAAFIFIDLLLFAALHVVTTRLEDVIESQTRALHDKAVHDELTGLYNRHYLDEFMETAFARAERRNAPFSVALMDLDHFKLVNDRHGHLVGDQVLADVAAIVRQRLRAADLSFRYGGEEFLLVFSDTPLGDALGVCESLRAQLAATSVGGLPAGSVTASFGVAERSWRCPSVAMLLRDADAAMYHAKAGGRDRVEVWA